MACCILIACAAAYTVCMVHSIAMECKETQARGGFCIYCPWLLLPRLTPDLSCSVVCWSSEEKLALLPLLHAGVAIKIKFLFGCTQAGQ